MKELLLAFMMIASRLSGLPMAAQEPGLMYLPAEKLCVAVEMCDDDVVVYAHYNIDARLMTLPVTWSSTNPEDLSILIHEMVHHLQAEKWPGGKDAPCHGDREAAAYEAQRLFLESLGIVWDMDPMTLVMLTQCED